MSSNGKKVNRLQVDVIENLNDNISTISINKGLRGLSGFDNTDPSAFLQRKDLDEVFANSKTEVVLPNTDPLVIHWQTDIIPGGSGLTWAEFRGNKLPDAFAACDHPDIPGRKLIYHPTLTLAYDLVYPNLIATVYIDDIMPGTNKIAII